MFDVLTAENSQHITLNDNAGAAPTEALIIGNDVRSIGWAVLCYAKRHAIALRRVGYAVRPATQREIGQ